MKYIVDLSDWQEEVNWQGLLNEGYIGAIIKLGESVNVTDTLMEKYTQAKENGFAVGLYYYSHASSEDEAINEAEWVAEQIRNYFGVEPELGIWYDYEEEEILKSGVDANLICKTFVEHLHSLGVEYVGVYSGYFSFVDYIGDLGDIPIWVAQYDCQNDYLLENPNANVKMWQFTNYISDDLPYDGNIYYL